MCVVEIHFILIPTVFMAYVEEVRCSGMKLIKLTDVCCGNTLYINSNCILSCEHKYHHESETWYTQVGILYENRFEFWYVKETIEDIQEQLRGAENAC
nr:MAG TPA: hypothetical protein [Caudoviricetes sp.]